jgi:hypothetical protein
VLFVREIKEVFKGRKNNENKKSPDIIVPGIQEVSMLKGAEVRFVY